MRTSYNPTRTTTRNTSAAARGGWQAKALVGGLALAASYFYVRAKTAQAERENPPRGRFIEVDGVRLHYLERGEGPVVVLLHGNGIVANDFETSGVLDALSERYRVIAFDRPGYGYSERPRTTLWTPDAQARLLHHALQELKVDSSIVVGHSWGTMVAMAMGLQVPDFVRGLVLLSGYYYPTLRMDAPVAAQPAIPILGDILRHTLTPLLARLIWPLMEKRVFSPRKVSERFRQLPVWMMLRPGQLRAAGADAALMAPAAMSLAKRYDQLRVPVQILSGTRDKIVTPAIHSERLHEALERGDPGSELQLEPGVGHMVHYAHPELVARAVDAIAAQVGEPVTLRSPRAEALARAGESGV
ncbi:alpha/beta fold hydrolase [Massilia haematophila]|uniref:Alpha/beta fold hydrolase n=1 Tax=Massilia haematophila TaxID=457923 RepID=A0ABV7PF83_9BURK